VAAVWYNGRGEDRVLEAFRPVDGQILHTVRHADAGREAPAEQLVRNIVSSYVAGLQDAGFCVGAGSLTIEPAEIEGTTIAFQHRAVPGLTIRIMTRTVNAADSTSLSNLDEEKDFAAATGTGLSVLVERDRSVAGLMGKEMRIVVTPPKETARARFTWHFDGAAGRDATKPKMEIIASANAANRSELESVWERMLSSLQPLPLARR
jgi:hypothetical protein